MSELAAMTPEQLAAITYRHANISVPYTGGKDILVDGWMNQADRDLGQLLMEVTRLRSVESENAALRETLDNAEGDFVTAMGWKSSHDHSD
jgi:hypothetical protein